MEIEQFNAGRANARFARCGSPAFPDLFPNGTAADGRSRRPKENGGLPLRARHVASLQYAALPGPKNAATWMP